MKKVIPFSSSERASYGRSAAGDTPPHPALARNVEQRYAGPEQQLLLLQRLIGCTDRLELIHRFHRWATDLGLADGTTFTPTAEEDRLMLGNKALHSAQYVLTLDGEALGTLVLCRRERYREEDLITIEQALGSLACSLRVAKQTHALRELVSRDPLTGLGNRSALRDALHRELSITRRHGSPLAVMMIDVDRFKALNDHLGHLGGDQVLCLIANVLKNSTRSSDLLFRFGGDEFAVLLPHTDGAGAEEAARQIRENLARIDFTNLGIDAEAETLRPDLSIGVTSHQTGDDEQTILQRADTHLYHAKAHGRGRVCSAV